MESLATIAYRSEKPRKDAAQDTLRDIYRELGDVRPDLAERIAPLYLYFMPRPPKRPRTWFDWVALAAQPGHYLLSRGVDTGLVHVTPQYMEGTDGHAVHRAPNVDGLAPGEYARNGERVGDPDSSFPDTESVIQRWKSQLSAVGPARDVLTWALEEWPNLAGKNGFRSPDGEFLLAKRYIEAALAASFITDTPPVLELTGSPSTDPARIVYGPDTWALVMPAV